MQQIQMDELLKKIQKYQNFYSIFRSHHVGEQHYACHSHHYWPDISFKAQQDYWMDSAKYVDDKWSYFFQNIIPTAQKNISKILNIRNHEQVVFSSNTHDFIVRIFSAIQNKNNSSRPIRILTTDSEFYSFERQLRSWVKSEQIEVTKIKVDCCKINDENNFENEFMKAISLQPYDLVFVSHVFFNSGYIVQNIDQIVNHYYQCCKEFSIQNPIFILDGYHGFMACPTDLKNIQDQIFYISGSYKYAQGGEGACFMTVPENLKIQPVITGWFAGFSELEKSENSLNFPTNGNRFAGSTMDFTAIYRLNSVFKLLEENLLSIQDIHNHVKNLQYLFLESLDDILVSNELKANKIKENYPPIQYLNKQNLLISDLSKCGHFLTFQLPTEKSLIELKHYLSSRSIKTDHRGLRLRFGFGLTSDLKPNWG